MNLVLRSIQLSGRSTGALRALLAGLLLTSIAGCGDHPEDRPRANQPPSVRITGGPLEGTKAAYTARIYWTGWDNDGIVQNYEYAIDPPQDFTVEEISHPEEFPDIKIKVIPGPELGLDTLRVSKTVDGVTRSFRWIQTTDYSRSFEFMTPNADSMSAGSSRVPDISFSGVHVVYVRARDDDGAYTTQAERLGYNAMTLVPESLITRPLISANILPVGSTITIHWNGLDADSPDPRKKPVGYVHRLLNLDSLRPPPSLLHVQASVLFNPAGRESVWTYQSADTLSHTFYLNTKDRYLFGVRAVDVAGAVEPFLDYGRNAFKFQSFAGGGNPRLIVSEPSLGTFEYRGSGTTYEVEVPMGAQLRFSWSASAEDYGGTIEGYSYGVDIPDLDREGPTSGWSGWGMFYANFQPIVFRTPGVHVVYVRARDVSGSVTLAVLIINVLEFPLDREVLLVDDSLDRSYPTDVEHDAFWASLFDDSGRFEGTDHFIHMVHGANDTYSPVPLPPRLSELGRYRTVIWTCAGSGYNGQSGLFSTTVFRKHLGAYLRAGGKLWLTGTMTVAASMPSATGTNADLVYPKSPTRGMFPFDFLKLYSDKIDNDKGTRKNNNLIGVNPFPGKPEIYPPMQADVVKVGTFKSGISHGDAVMDPIFSQDQGDFTGKIDSLYVYLSYVPGTVYNRKLNAIRWHDPDPARAQGRTQWFGFPLYFMKKEQAQIVFDRSIDWFREESIPQPGS
jgi:hypothetical protein